VLRTIRGKGIDVPVVLVTGFGCIKDAVTAMRLGAADFVEKPVSNSELLRIVEASLARSAPVTPSRVRERMPGDPEAHAARRWASIVMPVVDSQRDLPTLGAWGRYVAASIGALRNWCRTAGLGTRRSLVFGRLLRAAVLIEEQGAKSPENLLDVVDRRTIANLLRFAGLSDGLPSTASSYLERQTLVRDPAALNEIRRALQRRCAGREHRRSH
jgi:CheY-like chemotaxis protein